MTQPETSDLGIILRTFESGESNLICRILTKNQGKVAVLARAARKSKKRFPGGLECFDQGRIHLGRGKSDLEILLDFTPVFSRANIRGNLQRICCASLAVEVFDNLLKGDEHQGDEYFELLSDYLGALNTENSPSGPDLKVLLRDLFELLSAVLVISGYLEHDRVQPSAKGLMRLIEKVEYYTERELRSKSSVEFLIRDLKPLKPGQPST